MTDLHWTDGPKELMLALRREAAARAAAEVELQTRLTGALREADQRLEAEQKQADAAYQQDRAATEARYAEVRQQIAADYLRDSQAAQREYDDTTRGIRTRFEEAEAVAKAALQESRWQSMTIFEASKNALAIQLRDLQARFDAQGQEVRDVARAAAAVLRRRWQSREPAENEAAAPPARRANGEGGPRYAELLSQSRKLLHELTLQGLGRMSEGANPLAVFALVWLVVGGAAAATIQNWDPRWIVGYLGTGLVAAGVLCGWLFRVARCRTTAVYLALKRSVADTEAARRELFETSKAAAERQMKQVSDRVHAELKNADDRFAGALRDLMAARQQETEAAERKYPALLAEIAARRDAQTREADESFPRRLRELEEEYRACTQRRRDEHAAAVSAAGDSHQRQWNAMAETWNAAIAHFQASLDGINEACDRLFVPWSELDAGEHKPAVEMPPAIRFARFGLGLEEIKGGLSEDPRLRPERTEYVVPGLFPFRGRSLLLLKVAGAGRLRAIDLLQTIMLRMLTAIPPGKVRFMIIDPVGLGKNFSAFMHLADYNDQLVSHRIWTESAHIEERLAEMTEHMENVIQVYLRNEFQSILEYNAFAGELAEPFRILVVANFPVGFSENAARRLLSIVASGARCGVYTLLSVDTQVRLPRDFHLADLEHHATNLRLADGKFVWDDAELGPTPLVVEQSPPAEQFTALVRRIGQEAKDADRVELPFQCAAPEREAWWTETSAEGIDVPLGRAGAMKLQHLRLGRGTSQHVLIAGKTGSGKSTLLHALVTNVALRYTPDEVELYLIDFKKGVEFKGYAQTELPHARVIAIESEREFGVSVLERLDAELKRRGNLFRHLNVQDLPGFRHARPGEKLPRILLIIDEFQELFVEDDRIAQTCSLYLDRLVRQGRAFGIHVLLGSQTLAGSYSLPRSTLGQMAVRIALQCSEADAHLILSEENTAARLLTRPGEAIYNDANGLYEGNHPFQVVWLSEALREDYLRQVAELAGQRGWQGEPAIVFEGNVPADPAKNMLLQRALAGDGRAEERRVVRAWLGASVAIQDPPAAVFSRQGGSNLLLCGHQETSALGVLSAALTALAAQHAVAPADDPRAARFYLLDGTRPDAVEAGFWERFAPCLPQGMKVFPARQAKQLVAELAAELARREEAGEDFRGPSIYVTVYDVGRIRDLRRGDDEFNLGRFDEDAAPNPARQFRKILHEGPALGIHCLLWCDSYNTLNRFIDRQGLEDLEMRVVFQMNANDSSHLIDSPLASQLGVFRAYFYSDADGRMEKFRPYGPPTEAWLQKVRKQLQGPGSGNEGSGFRVQGSG